jgi:hypothetical protein
MPIGSVWADSNETHIFNPNWPPHGKIHGGQTLPMAVLLGVVKVLFAWRNSYPLGIAPQGHIETINFALVLLATYLALRRGGRWAGIPS